MALTHFDPVVKLQSCSGQSFTQKCYHPASQSLASFRAVDSLFFFLNEALVTEIIWSLPWRETVHRNFMKSFFFLTEVTQGQATILAIFITSTSAGIKQMNANYSAYCLMQSALHTFHTRVFEFLLSLFSYLTLTDLITRVSPRGAHNTERWCTTCAANYFVLHRACRQPTESVSGVRDDKASGAGCSGLITES